MLYDSKAVLYNCQPAVYLFMILCRFPHKMMQPFTPKLFIRHK